MPSPKIEELPNSQNFIAIQNGKSGDGKPCYGAFVDHRNTWDPRATTSDTSPQVGLVGMGGGGFLSCGTKKEEKHTLGKHEYVDERGNKQTGHISAAHFDVDTGLFKSHDKDQLDYDGPMEFKKTDYPHPPTMLGVANTWISWDNASSYTFRPTGKQLKGKWRLYTEIPSRGSEDKPPPPPPKDPPKDPEDKNPPPGTPVPPGGPPNPPGGGPPRIPVTTYPGGKKPPAPPKTCGGGRPPENPGDPHPPRDPPPPPRKKHTVTTNAIAASGSGAGGSPTGERQGYMMNMSANSFTSILAKPNQNAQDHQYDVRDYRKPPNEKSADLYQRRSPVTLRMEAWGGFKGRPNAPVTTQTPSGRKKKFSALTGPGGFWLMPPEVDLLDLMKRSSSTHVPMIQNGETSESDLGLTPGVNLSFGYPSKTTGKVEFGHKIKKDPSDDKLKVVLRDTSGTETNSMVFPDSSSGRISTPHTVTTNGTLIFKSSGSYEGIFAHSNTAARDYTFPNKSGTVKLKDYVTLFFPLYSVVAAGGSEVFVFNVPDDFQSLHTLELAAVPGSGTGSTLRRITYLTEYGNLASGEDHNNHTEGSTSVDYDWTGQVGKFQGLDLTTGTFFQNLADEDLCKVTATTDAGIGGSVAFYGVKMIYLPRD